MFRKVCSHSIISYDKWTETKEKEDKTHRLIDRTQNSHWFWHNEEAKFIIKKKTPKKTIGRAMLRFPWQPYFDSLYDLKDGLTFFCSGNSYLTFDFSSHFNIRLPSPTCCLITLLRQIKLAFTKSDWGKGQCFNFHRAIKATFIIFWLHHYYYKLLLFITTINNNNEICIFSSVLWRVRKVCKTAT